MTFCTVLYSFNSFQLDIPENLAAWLKCICKLKSWERRWGCVSSLYSCQAMYSVEYCKVQNLSQHALCIPLAKRNPAVFEGTFKVRPMTHRICSVYGLYDMEILNCDSAVHQRTFRISEYYSIQSPQTPNKNFVLQSADAVRWFFLFYALFWLSLLRSLAMFMIRWICMFIFGVLQSKHAKKYWTTSPGTLFREPHGKALIALM